ncbi:MAG TPA: hotdog domain-containing protein, partial [Gemmatimonadaceae bacterium]|nr:hotdog domain-containing protein [Gemmatimonadaceae bacterium]
RAAIHSEFYRPARLDDRLRVAAYVSRVGKKSLTLNFDVIRGDPVGLGAAGYQVLVCVERPTLQSRVIPPEVVRALVPFTLSVDDARSQLGVPKP